MNMKILRTTIVAVILAISLTIFVWGYGGIGARASTRRTAMSYGTTVTYHLRQGELVSIPLLGWTCNLSTLPNTHRPALFCTRDNKPIVGLWFSAHRIFVGPGLHPTRFKNGYAFSY
jgi:hypothetical protein